MTSLFILILAIVLVVALVKKANKDDRIGALIGGVVGLFVGSGVGLAFSGDAINGAVVFALIGGLLGYVMASNLELSKYIRTARSKIEAELKKKRNPETSSISYRHVEKPKPTNRGKDSAPSHLTKANAEQEALAKIPDENSTFSAGLLKFIKFILISSVFIFALSGFILAQIALSIDPDVSPGTVSFEYFLGTAVASGGIVTLSFVILSPFAFLSKKARMGINSKPFVPPLITFIAPTIVFSLILLGQAALYEVTKPSSYEDSSRSEVEGTRTADSNSGWDAGYSTPNDAQDGWPSEADFTGPSLATLFNSISSELPFQDGNRYYRSVRLDTNGLLWRVDVLNTDKSRFKDSEWRNTLLSYETDWICSNSTLRAVLQKGFTHTFSYYVDRNQWEMRARYNESDCL